MIGLALRLRFVDGEPALAEEGFGTVRLADTVERFARHLLHGMHRWQDKGAGFLTGPDF